ncbi:MAG: redoxin domain-containing protein [Mucilaginibacter sp.]
MKNTLLTLLCVLFAGTAFARAAKKDLNFVLDGKTSHLKPGLKIYLIYQAGGRRVLDSSRIKNQAFHFKGTASDPVFATLLLDHQTESLKNLSTKPVDEIDMLKLYLHKGQIRLTMKDSIFNAIFTWSTVNQDYARLQAMLNIGAQQQLYKLAAQMQRLHTPESEKRYVSFDDSLKLKRQPVLKRFVQEYPSSFIALEALKDYAGAFPDAGEIKPLFDALSPEVKNTKAGVDFAVLLNSNITVGTTAPDFVQHDPAGKPVTLSSFRGQYVLIDFWASWCPSCREENPALVKVYNALRKKNFTILGVSLDGQDTKAAWLKAIKDDKLTWTQVSDLKRWDTMLIKQYGINAIPQNVLIDPEGRVIAKNIAPEAIKDEIAKGKR